MNDKDIILRIEKVLEGTKYELKLFERDKQMFGNMVVKIESSDSKYVFVTDRGDIFCNHKLVIEHGYHIAGEDDTPIYLLKAIKTIIESC